MQVNPTLSDPFDGCGPSPVVIGSGRLYIQETLTGEAESIGNAEIVGFASDGDDVPVFPEGEDSPGAIAAYSQLRFDVTGDFFSLNNLSRYLNVGTPTPQASGFAIPLEIVRETPNYRVIFQKELTDAQKCAFPDGCTFLQVTLWRAHFQVQFDLGFQMNSALAPTYAILASPDADHPAQPYGVVEVVCPSILS